MNLSHERIQEFLSKDADGAALDWEREAAAAHLPGCSECREFRDAIAPIGAGVRLPAQRALAAADFSRFFAAVEAGMDRVDRDAKTASRAAGFNFTAFLTRAAAFGAVAAVLAVVLLGTEAATAPVTADAGAGVDVKAIEGGSDQTITIDDSSGTTVIWVEDSGAKS